ncbi:MAG: signal recognition particle-docking protein FtsY [Neisseriales bacterium]|nr:MAG: signal recognition particle-docking protein FtsY [Neisseriales bacterium]
MECYILGSLLTNNTWAQQLKKGLLKTRQGFGRALSDLLSAHRIDMTSYEQLKNILLATDMGLDAAEYLLSVSKQQAVHNTQQLIQALSDALFTLIHPLEQPLDVTAHQPFVVMMVGVNGAGKTTSIGKLAKYFKDQQKTVLLGAADTFRAAAYEQLVKWATLSDIPVVSKVDGDAAAVCYDAIATACAQHIDVVFIDTAGRLSTQKHLMDEIKKVKKVAQKVLSHAPHEILLTLDANTGLNSLSQAKAFDEALGVTGLVLTKLDGTAKGGIIAAMAQQKPIPLRFIGLGEGVGDIRPFIARDYVDALFENGNGAL